MTDDRLIRKIKRADRQAADQLISRYYDEIYVFVYRQIFDKQNAMDITQDVFVRMLRSLAGYDSSKASFRTWLYRIAASVLTDSRRKDVRQPMQIDIDDVSITSDEDFEHRIEQRDFARRVLQILTTKEELSQQIFRMKIFADHTLSQIASALDMPESSVKSRYYRLLRELREEIDYEQ